MLVSALKKMCFLLVNYLQILYSTNYQQLNRLHRKLIISHCFENPIFGHLKCKILYYEF